MGHKPGRTRSFVWFDFQQGPRSVSPGASARRILTLLSSSCSTLMLRTEQAHARALSGELVFLYSGSRGMSALS